MTTETPDFIALNADGADSVDWEAHQKYWAEPANWLDAEKHIKDIIDGIDPNYDYEGEHYLYYKRDDGTWEDEDFARLKRRVSLELSRIKNGSDPFPLVLEFLGKEYRTNWEFFTYDLWELFYNGLEDQTSYKKYEKDGAEFVLKTGQDDQVLMAGHWHLYEPDWWNLPHVSQYWATKFEVLKHEDDLLFDAKRAAFPLSERKL